MAEDAVVDDEAAFRYVGAIGPDTGRGGDVAAPGLQGDPVAGGIDRAGDNGPVPGNAPRLPVVAEAKTYAHR